MGKHGNYYFLMDYRCGAEQRSQQNIKFKNPQTTYFLFYDFLAFVNVNTLLRRLSVEFPTINRIPTIVRVGS